MDRCLNESEMFSRLDTYIEAKSSAYCPRPIGNEEILTNLFRLADTDTIRAVLLRGSRATGRSNPYSDVDLVALVRSSGHIRPYRSSDGVRYSIVCFTEVSELENAHRYFYGMKPIYDPEGLGQAVVEHLNALEKSACEEIPKGNLQSMEYLSRLIKYIGSDDVFVSSFFKAKLIREYPAFLSAYNGFELLGFKYTTDCLLRDDHGLALRYAAAMDRQAGQAEAKELIGRSFCASCGLNVLNTDFSQSQKAIEVPVGKDNMYTLYNAYEGLIEYLRLLKPDHLSEIDFYRLCEDKYPRLFARLWSLTH